MPINLHPQYITNDDGKRVSVILSIEEFNELIENQVDDLSYLSDEIEKGAKIGVTWTLVSEILGHQNHFYLDTKIGRHLDTFLDTPMKKIILS